jgi:hypothetical protein
MFGECFVNQTTHVIRRTELEKAAIQEVSEYLAGIDIGTEENNTLVKLMTRMVAAIETEQFCEGFSFALKQTVTGGV